MKKKFVVAMALTAGLCFAGGGQMKPALAGYWQVVDNPYFWAEGNPYDPDYANWHSEENDRSQGTVYWDIPSNSATYNWQDAGREAAGFGPGTFMAFYSNGLGDVSTGSQGQRRTKFHWVQNQIDGQDDPNDPPPATLNLKVYLHSYIELKSPSAGDNNDSVATSVEDVTGDVTYGDSPYMGGNPGFYKSDAHSTSVISVSTNGNKDVWTPWFQFSANAQGNSSDPNADQIAFGFLEYAVVQDPRSVTITSPTIETSYYKHFNPPYWVPEPHSRQDDNSMIVDSAAVWMGPDTNQGTDPGNWYGGGQFDLAIPNFTTPTITWSLDGGSAVDVAEGELNSGNQNIDLSVGAYLPTASTIIHRKGINLNGSMNGQSMVRQSVLSAKVVDADGVEGTNTYTINWH